MSRLPFEAFLALRYLRPRRTFVSVITLISIIGVLLGVTVLIVVIAVMSGFDKEWSDRILGFQAHLMVYKTSSNLADYESLIAKTARDPDVTGVSPIIQSQSLVKSEPSEGQPKFFAPLVLGVDPHRHGQVSVLPSKIITGKFDLEDRGAVVGSDLASLLGVRVGDRLAIYSPRAIARLDESRGKTNSQSIPIADEFTVRGIFDVGFQEYNSSIMAISLDDARDLFEMDAGAVNALQIKLKDPALADAAGARLQTALGSDYTVLTWKDRNPAIFNALAWEKNMMFFLLFFIMIVAAFGIVNCQITFVVQKTPEIGLLKALGATNREVLCLFLSQSVVVGVLGVGLGLALGLVALTFRNDLLMFLRNVTHSEVMPASIYQLYQLPASIRIADISIICGTAFLSCVLAGLFPAWKASRLQPVEALRHE